MGFFLNRQTTFCWKKTYDFFRKKFLKVCYCWGLVMKKLEFLLMQCDYALWATDKKNSWIILWWSSFAILSIEVELLASFFLFKFFKIFTLKFFCALVTADCKFWTSSAMVNIDTKLLSFSFWLLMRPKMCKRIFSVTCETADKKDRHLRSCF